MAMLPSALFACLHYWGTHVSGARLASFHQTGLGRFGTCTDSLQSNLPWGALNVGAGAVGAGQYVQHPPQELAAGRARGIRVGHDAFRVVGTSLQCSHCAPT